jgi:hypothetical protein
MSGAGLSPSNVSRPTIASIDKPPPFRSNQRATVFDELEVTIATAAPLAFSAAII